MVANCFFYSFHYRLPKVTLREWKVIYFLTRELVSCYRQLLRPCMRNKILRSANSKHHYILPFFYKIYKGDLPLMYSSFFWCEFIDQELCLWLVFDSMGFQATNHLHVDKVRTASRVSVQPH